jgi:arylamine N-acetyltransferase
MPRKYTFFVHMNATTVWLSLNSLVFLLGSYCFEYNKFPFEFLKPSGYQLVVRFQR